VSESLLGQFVVALCCGAPVARIAGHVARMRATFSWREKAFGSCVGAKTVKARGLCGPIRYFGLARRVPFARGLPFALGEKTCGTRFEHR
jgi:hypothetical protein